MSNTARRTRRCQWDVWSGATPPVPGEQIVHEPPGGAR
jgi:hypothetical protein